MNRPRPLPITALLVILTTGLHTAWSAPPTAPVPVTVTTRQTGAPINPFLYGQFIEHLGRCIYGGIWAEMLEDRKFYFPITADYDPYKSLQDTRFPVVGASPWQIIGSPEDVAMIEDQPFVGDHTPRLQSGSGIRQRDLALIAEKRYQGYIWLKTAGAGSGGPVDVALVWGETASERQSHSIQTVGQTYQKHEFAFTAGASTEAARLEVRVAGEAPVCIGTLSLMPADNVRGMRPDTLALLKQLNAPMYRWPGGNFVSGYDWRDGIGPRDRRPPRKNPAWTGVEHNDFGIDEFLDFCRTVDTEPMIAVNTGFGDAYSAAQEVEYCNGSTETLAGSWRERNGHPSPYQVRYWCVGNEMFGPWQLGFMQLSHYVQKHNRVAKKMRHVAPSIKLVGVGNLDSFNREHDPDQKVGWSAGMLENCHAYMDYISEHFYRGRTPWSPENPSILEHVGLLRESIREKADGHRALQKQLGLLPDSKVPIAMDEWNYWHKDYEYGELGCVYNLADALGVANGLHEYFRNTDIIHMAHYAQTVNVIGCIKTTKTDAFFSTTALPLMLYRQQFGDVPVEVAGEFESTGIDVAAALTSDHSTLTLGIVNANADARTLRVKLDDARPAGPGQLWQIRGDSPGAHNSVDSQPVSVAGPRDVTLDETTRVPAYSINLFRIPLR